MNLAEQLLEQIADPTLTRSERARRLCQLAKALAETGDYEGAGRVMSELWERIGERPKLDELDQATAAEVLLRVGALTSYIGGANQIEGAQEAAKNLLSESITIFGTLGNTKKVAEAQTLLGYCYFRQGEHDEARITLREARSRLTDEDAGLKAFVLLPSAIVEKVTGRLNDALRIHMEAAPLFEKIDDHALKGKFHNEFAQVLRKLGAAEHRDDYIDRALIEYAAASFHLEKAGHERFRACVENNLGFLFSTVGKFTEAHEHVDCARKIFARLKDNGSAAQVGETRARVLLAEGRNEEAERAAQAAVRALEKGDEKSLLAEALTTHGVTLARMGRHEQAREALERAAAVAEQVGDLEGAGQAVLTALEELGGRLAPGESSGAFERAAGLLAKSQHPGIKDRLLSCARALLGMYAAQTELAHAHAEAFTPPSAWEGFSFRQEMRRYERFIIGRALKDAGGVVSRAAQLLGFKHHHSLGDLLNKRHRDLRHAPVVPRRRSIFRVPGRPHAQGTDKQARVVTILHAEDNRLVADAVKESLQLEGWRVECCADGAAAQKKITGTAHYDLLLLDNDLPGVGGLELARLARKLPHRRRTPIIMLSAADCETDAWRAGVDAFLRKPGDVLLVADTVARLVNSYPRH